VSLLVRCQYENGKTVTVVREDTFTVGRPYKNGMTRADMNLAEDEYASNLHAMFCWHPDLQMWTIEDLGSTNGTYLLRDDASERVYGQRTVRRGDVVRVGRTRLTVVPC